MEAFSNDTQTFQALNMSWWDQFSQELILNIGEELRLEDLAKFAGTSKFSLSRAFQKKFGMPPMRWVWRIRAILAREILMVSRQWTVTDVAFMCGFTSSSHFSRFMKIEFKTSPKTMLGEAFIPNKSDDLFELTTVLLPTVLKMAA